MTYTNHGTARRIARMKANRTGQPYAIVTRDRMTRPVWEVFPAHRLHTDESAAIVEPSVNRWATPTTEEE